MLAFHREETTETLCSKPLPTLDYVRLPLPVFDLYPFPLINVTMSITALSGSVSPSELLNMRVAWESPDPAFGVRVKAILGGNCSLTFAVWLTLGGVHLNIVAFPWERGQVPTPFLSVSFQPLS